MKAICVDDERLLMEDTAAMCLELPEITAVKGFVRAADALEWLETEPADLALLDIDMPEMNGIQLAARIKERWPDTAVIFLTGYPQYAVDAFAVRASGYLLKPVTREALAADVAYALSGKTQVRSSHVTVQTFGSFDVFVDGSPVSFRMAKCKEILAYLVDRQGGGATRAEIAAMLWEDRIYDRKLQKQLDVYIRSLRDTLREHGIEEILEMQKGVIRVRPAAFTCDAYLFFSGDRDAVNAYRGEYMSAYSWASMTESMMYWKVVDQS
jgi:two-component SAPR family response regulator